MATVVSRYRMSKKTLSILFNELAWIDTKLLRQKKMKEDLYHNVLGMSITGESSHSSSLVCPGGALYYTPAGLRCFGKPGCRRGVAGAEATVVMVRVVDGNRNADRGVTQCKLFKDMSWLVMSCHDTLWVMTLTYDYDYDDLRMDISRSKYSRNT